MDNARLLQLGSRFVANELTPDELAEFRQAIATFPQFADDVRQQVAVDSLARIRYGQADAKASWDEVVRRLNKPVSVRRGRVLRLLIPLAAAAAALVAVRQFVTPADTAPYRIVRQIGPVAAENESLTTGPGGFAQAVFRDGTVLALDENTRLRFADPTPGAPSDWHHDAGRFYLATGSREDALLIASGDARFAVLGTRLEIAHEPAPHLSVFEGRVRAEHGEAALLVHAGQTARMVAVSDRQRFVLAAPLPIEEALAWTDKLDLDRDGVLAAARAAHPPKGDPAIDFRHALTLSGDWSIEQDGETLRLRQNSPQQGRHLIQLGLPQWERATLSYKFRIIETHASEYGAGALFFDETRAYHSFVSTRGLQQYRKAGHRGWMRVRQTFERQPDGRIMLSNWELWPEEAPRKRTASPWPGDPGLRFRQLLGVGFAADNCTIEFADIEIRPVR